MASYEHVTEGDKIPYRRETPKAWSNKAEKKAHKRQRQAEREAKLRTRSC